MAGLLSNPTSSITPGLTPTYLGSVINAIMTAERQPLIQLKAQRDQILVQRGLYSSTQTLLKALKDLTTALAGGSTTSTVFGARSTTSTNLTSSTTTALTASASSGAAVGTYDVVTGGNSVLNKSTNTSVTNFAAGSIQSSQTGLTAAKYYVETRASDGKFRLIDGSGNAIAISSTSAGTGSMTTDWVAAPSGGGTYQTGRGLDITFAATISDGTKAAGTAASVDYSLGLAKTHRVISDVQATGQALNLSGTFVIGGRATGANPISNASTPTTAVTSFSGVSVASGQTELAMDKYYVETRETSPGSGSWQFRLLDDDGKAVSISDTSAGTGTMTSNWVSVTASTNYDTGRGLKIQFGGTLAAGSKDAGTAASLNYTSLGASITVSTSDTLENIRDNINNATYVSGNAVSATIIGSQLVLSAGRTGSQHGIVASDTSGTVLQSLGVLTSGSAFKNVLHGGVDASFTVNGIVLTRSSNTVDNAVTNLTLNLLQETSSAQTTRVTVGADTTTVTNKLTEFLNKMNEVVDYVRSKSAVDYNASTKTYTPGGLTGDTVFTQLRGDLVLALTQSVTGQAADQPQSLSDIGITLGTGLHFSISDSSKLTTALSNNYQAVASLVDKVMDRLYDSSSSTGVLAPFVTDNESGILTSKINASSTRTDRLSSQISQMEGRLQKREDALTDEFGRLLSQATFMNAQRAYAAVIFTQNLYG